MSEHAVTAEVSPVDVGGRFRRDIRGLVKNSIRRGRSSFQIKTSQLRRPRKIVGGLVRDFFRPRLPAERAKGL